MDDWELLEAAAKAAGYEFGVIHGTPRIRCDAGWTPWNPRDDDGDALRLAMQIGMRVSVREVHADGGAIHEVGTGGDFMDATRRAIVRAAVAMTRKLPQ